jgi:hypothetical protein
MLRPCTLRETCRTRRVAYDLLAQGAYVESDVLERVRAALPADVAARLRTPPPPAVRPPPNCTPQASAGAATPANPYPAATPAPGTGASGDGVVTKLPSDLTYQG